MLAGIYKDSLNLTEGVVELNLIVRRSSRLV